ncbi:hypothetical protein ACFOOK_30640 [Micromonospora krabiensis]|uniref:Uncharacterized protein n=1 Tax=Micromonospora krabiensis TaxID=307121 RepID=A0A1C3N347_9ACTN|nr:hypothetical protein [Micromonospora krabiensis]SBV26985.1 hypothetical protein GA0070620_2483 [Micromonospora krabiensis]
MDEKTYAAITDVCARLAGRLSDDTLGTVREQYAAGEWDLADATLLLNLAYEDVDITRAEQDLIRSFLGDPSTPDLTDVPVVAEVPPPPYRFSPAGPATAPDPTAADRLLSAEAPLHGGRVLRRAWREPVVGARGGPTWVYVVRVADGADELKAYSGLMSRLWSALRERWPLEVVAEGRPLPPYQAAALAAAGPVHGA